MGRISSRAGFICLLLLSLGSAVAVRAQDIPNTPAWVSYSEGQRLLDRGSLGEALASFRKALATATGSLFPEAEVGIGIVLEREGESKLAEQSFLHAIAQRNLFYIRQNYYVAWYRLAEIYKRQLDYSSYEQALVNIVDDDPYFHNPELAISKQAYRKTLTNDGLDKLVLLYRLSDDFSFDAHKQLGIFYVSTGKYTDALDHMIFATLKILTASISELMRVDPGYRFSTMQDLLDRINSDKQVAAYANDRGLFECLYFLAASLYGQGDTGRAVEVWRLVASRPEAGAWAERARSKASHPALEPLIRTK